MQKARIKDGIVFIGSTSLGTFDHYPTPFHMLLNNLDPEVAERPEDLVVYGGRGKAARNWDCLNAIIQELTKLENDETLLVQSGKPVAVFKTHEYAPRVLIANSNLVGHWANWDVFDKLEKAGLIMRRKKRSLTLAK